MISFVSQAARRPPTGQSISRSGGQSLARSLSLACLRAEGANERRSWANLLAGLREDLRPLARLSERSNLRAESPSKGPKEQLAGTA